MNKKERILITLSLAILGGYLFYRQGSGVNKLIFTVMSAVIVIYLNWGKRIGLLSLALLPAFLSSVFIVWYPQLLTQIIWLLSILVMWSSMVSARYPIVTFLQGVVSIFESPFSILKKNELDKIPKESTGNRNGIIYVVTAIIVLIFIALYINSNPVFSALFSKIDLSFIKFGFILTVVGLFLLFYGLVKVNINKNIQKLNSIGSYVIKTELSKRDEQEFIIARLSIWIIGAILFVANIGDLIIIFTGKLPEGMTYSEYVHQGFYTLLFTLSLAIGLVIYFFRGQLNFHEKLKFIKSASLFWISQNLLLALITAYKNLLYVQVYGLTYKRIAVFLGLLCILIGLVLSIKKLQKPFTNWFYFNKLSVYAFVCFLLISFIPMDRIITKYNLTYSKTIDIDYLLSLSKPNLELVYDLVKENEDQYSRYLPIVERKISDLNVQSKECTWQSWNFYIDRYKRIPK